MHKYAARRLLALVPTLLIMSILLFLILRVLPGDITAVILGDVEEGSIRVSQSTLEVLREELGLNRPLHLQYVHWLWDISRGDLGTSLLTRKPVSEEILHRLPLTLQIAFMAKVLALLFGIPIGIMSAIKRNSWLDYLLRVWSIFFLAAPNFWLGLLVLMGGVIWFMWSPPLGYNLIWKDPTTNMLQLIWPILILALSGMAIIARMTRSTMLEVLREDYVRTARAKGLTERVVIYRHALKNAMIPVVTLAGLSFGHLLGGTVIMETVFSIPGMGLYMIEAIRNRDYPIVQGVAIMIAAFFMLVNLVVDLLYAWLDPRISYS